MHAPFLAEFLGTCTLIVFGAGVNANVILNKSKGQNSGWIVIAFGWAMAVFMGVNVSTALGGEGHINSAFTIAVSAFGDFPPSEILTYITAQFAGALCGSTVAWAAYKQHFDASDDPDGKLAVFCNAPAIRHSFWNLVTEIIGTFVLVLGASLFSKPAASAGGLNPLPVALLILGIGLSLGGPTGYAINPARDLGPRIAHFLLPIPGKRDSDWGYSWIPVIGPVIGGLLGAFVFKMITS